MIARKSVLLTATLFGVSLVACSAPPPIEPPPLPPPPDHVADAGSEGDAGISCPEASCEVGAVRCQGEGEVQRCEADGSGCGGWVLEMTCAMNEACHAGACVVTGQCALGCPPDHVCTDDGVCVGEPGNELILNVETTELTVRVRNGEALPQVVNCPADGRAMTVTAYSREMQHAQAAYIPCDSEDFEVSLRLPRGNYEVIVQDALVAAAGPWDPPVSRATDLPMPPFHAFISAREASLAVVADFKLFEVRGTVLRNGQPPVVDPVACAAQGSAAVIRFHREDSPQKFVVTLPCDAPSFDFVAHVYGTRWTVDVALADGPLHHDKGFDWGIYHPVRDYVTHEALAVGDDMQGLVLDVPSVPLAFNVLLNGMTPVLLPACDVLADPGARAADVILTEPDTGYQHRLRLPCGDPTFSLTTEVFPGRYLVTVSGVNRGIGPTSSLPPELWSPPELLDVTQPQADVTFDLRTRKLSVDVLVDGQLAQVIPEHCDLDAQYPYAGGIRFRHETTWAEFGTPIRCDGSFSVSDLEVYEGTYEVTVSRSPTHEQGSTLVWDWYAMPGVVVDAQTEKIVIDQPSTRYSVTASLRWNGAPLPVPVDCGAAGWGAKLWLYGNGTSHNIIVPCDDVPQDFASSLLPGSYRAYLTLHPEHLQALGFPANTSGFTLPSLVVEGSGHHDFDLVLRTVEGRVLVDGAPIQVAGACPEWLGAVRVGWTSISSGEVACGADVGRFSLYAQPGTHQVEVSAPLPPGNASTQPPSNLPPGSYRVIDKLQIP